MSTVSCFAENLTEVKSLDKEATAAGKPVIGLVVANDPEDCSKCGQQEALLAAAAANWTQFRFVKVKAAAIGLEDEENLPIVQVFNPGTGMTYVETDFDVNEQALEFFLQQQDNFFTRRASLAQDVASTRAALDRRTESLRPQLEEIAGRAKIALQSQLKQLKAAQQQLEMAEESGFPPFYQQAMERLQKAQQALNDKGEKFWSEANALYAKYPEFREFQDATWKLRNCDDDELETGQKKADL
jgi:hypothetical protein